MDRETLVANLKAATAPVNVERQRVKEEVAKALLAWMDEANVRNLAILGVINHSIEQVSIAVPSEKRAYGIELGVYFYEDYPNKKRTVMLNACTFGSFSATMKPEINYYVVVGALASKLQFIQDKIDAIDFDTLRNLEHTMYHAQHELEAFDRAIKDAEEKKHRDIIESQLIVGAKLRIGTTWKNEPIYDVIEKTTNKLIYLKNDYGSSTKKVKAIDNIINKKWEIA